METNRKYPIATTDINDKSFYLGFRVVTEDMKSLGLRHNPNIISYKVGEWIKLEAESIKLGKDDFGGIWVARTLSGARALQRYMKKKHGIKTRIFEAAIGEILFANSYRVKTDRILLLSEVV